MSDLALGTDGDVKVQNFDLVLVTGVDAIIQRLRIALQTFAGEWYLNTLVGLPYFADIMRKNPNNGVIASAFKTLILSTPGVLSLDSFTMSFDPTKREMTLDFSVTVDGSNGSIPVIEVI